MFVVWLKISIFLKFCGLKAIRPLVLLWGHVLFALGLIGEELQEVQMTTIISWWPVGSISLTSAWILMIKGKGRKTKLHLPNQAHQPAPLGCKDQRALALVHHAPSGVEKLHKPLENNKKYCVSVYFPGARISSFYWLMKKDYRSPRSSGTFADIGFRVEGERRACR